MEPVGTTTSPPDRAAIRARLDALAKPQGALGLLESWSARACALQQTLQPSFPNAAVIVFAADHGVTAARPKITAYPRSITVALLKAVAAGVRPSSAALAAASGFGAVEYVDVGCDNNENDEDAAAAPPPPPLLGDGRITIFSSGGRPGSCPLAIHTHGSDKVCRRGTADLTRGAAMTREELRGAVEAGRRAVRRAVRRAAEEEEDGEKEVRHARPLSAVALGEMGLGNTTSAAALAAALTGARPEEVCGRGTGVDDAGLRAKQVAVADALEANRRLIEEGEEEGEEGEEREDGQGGVGGDAQQHQHQQQQRALRALRAVGGLELAAIAGAVWECADQGIAVLVDGFICGAAALAAVTARPRAARCLFPSHASAELGAARVLRALDAAIRRAEKEEEEEEEEEQALGKATTKPAAAAPPPPPPASLLPFAPLDMGLRLGEATGAVLALPLLQAAAALVQDTALLSDVLAAAAGAG
jgi:nicotinate-nucleotide--dimethylbenzimidazole phosphoribosyltransferase